MDTRHRSNRSRVSSVTRTLLLGWAMGIGVAPSGQGAAPAASPLTPYQSLFRSPTRTAIDAQGFLYVTDSRAGNVLKLGTNGTLLVTASGLAKPLAVAVGNQGRVYVGEENTGRVLVFDSTLTNAPVSLGAGTNEFNLPNHIAVDTTQSNGWVYVSDSRTHQIRCYANTTLVGTFGSKGSGNGQFDFPAGVYVSPAQEVYVVDQNNDRVQVFDLVGSFKRAFSLRTPADVATTNIYGRAQGIVGDGAGYIYVTDAFQDEIKVFDTQGVYQATFGMPGGWIGQLSTPGSLALGADSRLFVTSVNNNRIEVFRLLAAVVPITLQVVSAYGVPSPAAGIYTNVSGAVLTNSVTLTDPRTTTQYVCTGWVLTGNSPQSGLTNFMVMTQTNSAVLTWLWKTQYNLTVTAGPNGTATPTNSWWDAGASTAASATPLPYYGFSQWTGALSSTNNPLPLTMNQPYNLMALFAANLATNGVPQWWLASYGVTNGGNWDAAALADSDGDGVPNWQEWLADTVPTNPLSFLGFTAIGGATSGATLTWQGGVLSTQYLERADSPGSTALWVTIFTNLPPTATSANRIDSYTNTTSVYRIRVAR